MKKITSKQINKFVESFDPTVTKSLTVGCGDEKIEIEVKPILTVDEFSSFVRSVVDGVFVDGEYHAELLPYVVEKATIAYYSNIDSGFNNKVLNALVYHTNVYGLILCNINSAQHADITECVHRAIEYRTAIEAAKCQYGTHQIQNAIVAEQEQLMAGMTELMNRIKEVSEKFDPEMQKTSLDFMHKVNSMDNKALVDNLIDFTKRSKSDDGDE